MKKAGILTYYNVHNHGSTLQAYGLKKILESLGYEVVFLDFERNYDFLELELVKKYKITIKSFSFFLKYMFQRGFSNIIYNLKKRKKLNSFIKRNLGSGIRYSNFQGDLVVIGSDEVFSTQIGINPCFYGFGIQSQFIISYAASFGPTTIEDIQSRNLEKMLSSGMNTLSEISVRDDNSRKIIEILTGISPQIVCDPVILYGYKDEQNTDMNLKHKYILLYSYDKNMNESNDIKNIKKFAKEKGFKIYSIGYHHKWCDKNICPLPFELLSLFKKASFIITDTFHGAVISLITNSQFSVKISNNANKLKYLLEEYKLTNRLIENFSSLNDLYINPINYDVINTIIEEKRAKSYDFLKKVIKKEGEQNE